jgi:hypothetical protein
LDRETVDWKETVRQANSLKPPVPDIDKKIKGFLNVFYRGTDKEFKLAREHHQVIKSYKLMAARTAKYRNE